MSSRTSVDDLARPSTGSGESGSVAGLDAGDVEHLVDELEQVAAALEDLRRPTSWSVLGEVVELEQLREPEDRVERRAQLVAHPRQELALGPVGGLGRVAGLALGLLEPLALVERLPELGGAFLDQTEGVDPAPHEDLDQAGHQHRGQQPDGEDDPRQGRLEVPRVAPRVRVSMSQVSSPTRTSRRCTPSSWAMSEPEVLIRRSLARGSVAAYRAT